MGERGKAIQDEVLAILRRREGPSSAYEVLGALRETVPNAAPPTVYRALKALTGSGAVHRLESLNAFMACKCAEHTQPSVMSICDDCGSVQERVAPDVLDQLTSVMSESGFAPRRQVIEVFGTCSDCGSGEAAR